MAAARSRYGYAIDAQAKQMAYNVYSYFKRRKLDKNTLEYIEDVNLGRVTAEATGLSERTIIKIVQQGNILKHESENKIAVFEDEPKRKQVRKKKIDLDDETKEKIKQIILDKFAQNRNRMPTLKYLTQAVKDAEILNCSREYLRLLLLELGFTPKKSYSKVEDLSGISNEQWREQSPLVDEKDEDDLDLEQETETKASDEEEDVKPILIKIEYGPDIHEEELEHIKHERINDIDIQIKEEK